MTKKLPLSAIRIDADTQSRVAIDETVVAEYAELLKLGNKLPPMDVHHDGIAYWLSDGFHRWHAYKRNGTAIVDIEYHEGTASDARWHAAGSNVTHGLRRSIEDKRRAVRMALDVHGEMSDRAIADHCYVSPTFVGEIRRGQVSTLTPETPAVQPAKTPAKTPTVPPPPPPKRVGLDGKAYAPPRAKTPTTPTDAPTVTQTPLYVDCVGRAVPADMNATWEGRDELEAMRGRLRDVRLQLEAGHKDGDKCLQRVGATVLAMIQRAEGELVEAMPYALCPVCQGVGCKLCRKTGFVGKQVYETAVPEQYKEVDA
jgi:hypothetical protein